MSGRSRLCIAALLALIAALAALPGCSPARTPFEYLKYRYEDFCDMADIGMTFSLKPGLAIYANGVGVSPGGFAYIDGYFLGIGGGGIGVKKFFFRSIGLVVWGQEKIGWDNWRNWNNRTFNEQGVGPLGIVIGPHGWMGYLFGGGQSSDYMFACIHNVHILFVGAVANLRYTQAPDFILGWFGLDPSLDDGTQFGRLPWQRRRTPPSTDPAETPGDMGAGDAKTAPVEVVATFRPAGGNAPPREATFTPVAAAPPAVRTYVVRRGDTFFQIAQQIYGKSSVWQKLYEANRASLGLAAPESLRAGMILSIPPLD